MKPLLDHLGGLEYIASHRGQPAFPMQEFNCFDSLQISSDGIAPLQRLLLALAQLAACCKAVLLVAFGGLGSPHG